MIDRRRALFEMEDASNVIVVAVRHQLENRVCIVPLLGG